MNPRRLQNFHWHLEISLSTQWNSMKSEVFTHPAVQWSNTIIMMHALALWICHPTLKNTNTSRITPNKINKEKLTNSCIVAGGNIHFFYFYLLPFLFWSTDLLVNFSNPDQIWAKRRHTTLLVCQHAVQVSHLCPILCIPQQRHRFPQ